MSMIEGKGIRFIRHSGGLVAGDPEIIYLWQPGGVITVTKPEDVDLINSLIKQAKRINVNVNDYVAYMLIEEGW